MIQYTTATSENDLHGILKLQKKNLPQNLNHQEKEIQGFVTVDHDFETLKNLHEIEPHIIAKDGEKIVGYVLTMTKKSRQEIPLLFPMFEFFDQAIYRGKPVSEYNYMLVGQVCVAKEYRGKGVFSALYQTYKNTYKNNYDFAITEVAASNPRSLRAHEKKGFTVEFSYTSPDGTEWLVILLDWNSKPTN